jgi:F-box-like
MSISSISQSNELGTDVLQMIFHGLEGEDLLNCEAVCREWRDILLAGTPWRRLFHRKIASFPVWRRAQNILESNQLILRTEEYRDACKNILQVNRNLRTGNFTKWTYPVRRRLKFLAISDDYLVCYLKRTENDETCGWYAFLDIESKEIKETRLDSGHHVPNQIRMELFWDVHRFGESGVDIHYPKNEWFSNVMNEEDNGFRARQISYGSKLIVCYSACANNRERMRIWKMGNPPILLQDRTFEDRDFRICTVDERFIVARKDRQITSNGNIVLNWKTPTLYFISTGTFEEIRTLSVTSFEWKYDRGLLFQFRDNGIVRVMDVATGAYFNDIHKPFGKEDDHVRPWPWAASNSIVMVIGWKYSTESSGTLSHLSVYDLEAAKKQNSDPGCHLLYTLQFQLDIEKFVMNESEIAVSVTNGTNNRFVTVLKFVNFGFAERKSFALQENPEANEDEAFLLLDGGQFNEIRTLVIKKKVNNNVEGKIC